MNTALARPDDDPPGFSAFAEPPKPGEEVLQTFCGTSGEGIGPAAVAQSHHDGFAPIADTMTERAVAIFGAA